MARTDSGDTATSQPGLVERLAVAATAIATVGLVTACLVCWIPVWPAALFEHFRIQYVATGLIIVAATAVFRMRGFFDVAAIATLVHGLALGPDLAAAPATAAPGGVALRVLILNVHTESSSFDQVRSLIADEHPDVVGLVPAGLGRSGDLVENTPASGRRRSPRG